MSGDKEEPDLYGVVQTHNWCANSLSRLIITGRPATAENFYLAKKPIDIVAYFYSKDCCYKARPRFCPVYLRPTQAH